MIGFIAKTGVLLSNTAFSWNGVLIAGVVVGAVGLLLGLLLGVFGKLFRVDVNEKEELVRELLPGNNCGGCGYAGCDALAKAIAEGTAPANACPVGRDKHAEIARVMGQESTETEKQIAFVKCRGTCDKTKIKYHYEGIADCRKLALIPGNGEKVCRYGCMGYGSCVDACNFGAIAVIDGVAVVDREACVACGACVKACPNHLIELIPYSAVQRVGCNSKDNGKQVRAECEVGCIACKLCEKACAYDAVHVTDNLAKIDYSKCTRCGACAEKCPRHIIIVPEQ